MFKLCISHCDRKNVNLIFGIIKRYKSNFDIEVSIPADLKYELDYFVRNRDIDAYILDPKYIHNSYDGIFIAERMKTINPDVIIIFTSESISINNLLRIINVGPSGYIMIKDLNTELPKFLDKLIFEKRRSTHAFSYLKRGKVYTVQLNNVIYFRSSHRTVEYICIDGKKDIFYDKLGNIEKIISQLTNSFTRISQSYLINKNFVISINANEVTMENGDILLRSRKYHSNLHDIEQS